jgi:hypothetical protein
LLIRKKAKQLSLISSIWTQDALKSSTERIYTAIGKLTVEVVAALEQHVTSIAAAINIQVRLC